MSGCPDALPRTSDRILSFETPEEMAQVRATGSTVRQSDTLARLGTHSLQWDWQAGATITMPLFHHYAKKTRLSTFPQVQCLVIWLYNDRPNAGHFTLELGSNGAFPISCSFHLNYTGWRTGHIPLSQMEGGAPQAGDYTEYEHLRICVPDDHPECSGRLFIDDVYTTMLDARHPSADYQAPYVRCCFNGAPHVTQWLNQAALPSREDLRIKQIPISDGDLQASRRLYEAELQNQVGRFSGDGLSPAECGAALRQLEELGIREVEFEDKTYLQSPCIGLRGEGLPPSVLDAETRKGRFLPVHVFQKTLHALACSYHTSTDDAQRSALRDAFLLATRAYLQSGWAAGSNMGSIHHLGYATRTVAPSFLMMKQELADAGLLQEVSDSLNWYVVAHVVNDETHTDPDLDLFNTVLQSHCLVSMLRLTEEDCARHAMLLSQWLSRTVADGSTWGGFRPDGTAWHHWGHYPAYTGGAIDSAVKVANALTGAGFPLTPKGHAALQKAVKAILLYSEGNRFPRSLCGRHPLRGSHKRFIEAPYTAAFVDLAPVDEELQRLHAYHTADGSIAGHWTLPYSDLSLHRRDDYLAAVRGFDVNCWGAEIYGVVNRFGRYQSYGTLDILYKGEPALPYEGYDWNLNPGTTITYLPLEELEAPIPVWMVTATTRFANGVHDRDHRNGAHGFELDDAMFTNKDPGYEEISTREKLTARKSTFFMDDLILCLGTGISGQHDAAPVYTVLTQRGIDPPTGTVVVNGEDASFPYEQQLTGPATLFDGNRTGFLVMGKDTRVLVRKQEQVSRGDAVTFIPGRQAKPHRDKSRAPRYLAETRGNFLSACIDHGVQPRDARYEYVVCPGVDRSSFQAKATRLQANPRLFYRIISWKNALHAVHDVRTGTDTYVLYEAQDLIPHAALHAVSEPCLLMCKEDEAGGYMLSVALPDLHVTAFSREHKHKSFESRPHELKLIFGGLWTLPADAPDAVCIEQADGRTTVTIRARHGQSYHVQLNSDVAPSGSVRSSMKRKNQFTGIPRKRSGRRIGAKD